MGDIKAIKEDFISMKKGTWVENNVVDLYTNYLNVQESLRSEKNHTDSSSQQNSRYYNVLNIDIKNIIYLAL